MITLPELSAFRFPFRELELKTDTVAGVAPKVNAKASRSMPPPPGFTMALVIAISVDKILELAEIVGVFNDTESG